MGSLSPPCFCSSPLQFVSQCHRGFPKPAALAKWISSLCFLLAFSGTRKHVSQFASGFLKVPVVQKLDLAREASGWVSSLFFVFFLSFRCLFPMFTVCFPGSLHISFWLSSPIFWSSGLLLVDDHLLALQVPDRDLQPEELRQDGQLHAYGSDRSAGVPLVG